MLHIPEALRHTPLEELQVRQGPGILVEQAMGGTVTVWVTGVTRGIWST